MKDQSFESSLEKLEQASENLNREGISLEDAIKYYEEGVKHYKICKDILKESKQKIETFDKKVGE